MSEESISEVARKLEVLKSRFKEKALKDIGLVQEAADQFRLGRYGPNDIAAAYHSLHRLAGSAGTFGYSTLGEEARALEMQLKPLAEADGELTPARIQDVVDLAFVSRVAGLVDFLSLDQGTNTSATLAPLPVAGDATSEPVVLILYPDQTKAEELVRGLRLHGFQPVPLGSVDKALKHGFSEVAALVVQDALMLKEGWKLDSVERKPPIICLGDSDSFESRYALAQCGVDGFLREPADLPALEHYGLVLEEGGLEVWQVNNPADILMALSEFRPDIVLMDVQMGAFRGPDLARLLRFQPEWLGLPIIYLSSEADREFQVDALAKGGDDFLTKPISDAFLLRAVTVRCYRARQLDKLVSRDSLTGLLKHSVARSEISKEHARCQRRGESAVVAMLDLDHFKQINDRFGHPTGDLVIKGLANLLRHQLRKSDVIGRYGGEEFIVALPDCSIENAQRVMMAVCEHMAAIGFHSDGKEFSVTLSVGMVPMQNYLTSDDAIEAADQALYQQKQAGRNGVMVGGQIPNEERTLV